MNNIVETIVSQTHGQPRVLMLATTKNGQLIIEENESYRWIRDNDNAYYSVLDKQLPGRLVLPYLQTMMAALLFMPEPRSVLLLGAGGGSLIRFFNEYFSNSQIRAIDYDSTVIEITEKYFLNSNLSELNIINREAKQYISNSLTANTDMLFIDLFSHGVIPNFFNDIEFYENCKRNSRSGISVFNLIIETENSFKHLMGLILSVFNKRCLCLTVADFKNIIVLAFSENCEIENDVMELRSQCTSLQNSYKINFSDLLDEIIISNECIENKIKI